MPEERLLQTRDRVSMFARSIDCCYWHGWSRRKFRIQKVGAKMNGEIGKPERSPLHVTCHRSPWCTVQKISARTKGALSYRSFRPFGLVIWTTTATC